MFFLRSTSTLRATTSLTILLTLAMSVGAHSSAAAQAAATAPAPAPSPPPASAEPAPPPPPTYPPQQIYPQQTYPQQAYPQQYPQPYQAYQQAYPQTVYVTQPLRPLPPRPRRTLMIAGISVFMASYGVGVVTGAALVDSKCCEDVGWSLLIPVAGPYIAAGIADEGKGLLVLLGTVQVIGLGLTIGGAVQYALSKKAAARTSALELKLPEGRALSFDVSSSPRLAGPTMKLRF